MNLLFYMFYFCFYFFKWRRILFTFFLLFNTIFLLFVLLFQIPKKIEVQFFSYAYQCHTWAMMGLWSLIPPKSKKRKKPVVLAFPRVRKNHFERFYLVVGVAFILCTPKVKFKHLQPVFTVSHELKISCGYVKNRRFEKFGKIMHLRKLKLHLRKLKSYAFYPSGYTK